MHQTGVVRSLKISMNIRASFSLPDLIEVGPKNKIECQSKYRIGLSVVEVVR